MHRTCYSCVIFSNIIAERVISKSFRCDVTDVFSSYIAVEYDGSLIDSVSMGHEGVIKCNIVTNVFRMCLRMLYTVMRLTCSPVSFFLILLRVE